MTRRNFPGMGGNMQQIMMQAQKMQQDVARVQQEVSEREFTSSVGGGVVSVTVNGSKEVKTVTIDPSCVDPEDTEMLQDLIISAVNEALRMAEEAMTSEMNRVTGGMNLGL